MPKLGVTQVSTFLADHFGRRVGHLEVLTGGEWSQAFAFRSAHRDLVIRYGDHVDDFEKDRAAYQFSSEDLPVPEVFEIGEGLGLHFCVSERIFGEMIDGLDQTRMRKIISAVLRLLDALRQADFSKCTTSVGVSAQCWHDQLLSADEENDRVFGWHDKLRTSPTGNGSYDAALAYLRAHIQACPEADYLIHNDLLHNNVLVQGDKIAGVIDWGCAGRGDFLYELAMFTFYAPWYPAMAGIDWRDEAHRHYAEIGLEVPEFDARLRCYEAHLGLTGMAYSAFKENWGEVAWNAQRTIEILGTIAA